MMTRNVDGTASTIPTPWGLLNIKAWTSVILLVHTECGGQRIHLNQHYLLEIDLWKCLMCIRSSPASPQEWCATVVLGETNSLNMESLNMDSNHNCFGHRVLVVREEDMIGVIFRADILFHNCFQKWGSRIRCLPHFWHQLVQDRWQGKCSSTGLRSLAHILQPLKIPCLALFQHLVYWDSFWRMH